MSGTAHPKPADGNENQPGFPPATVAWTVWTIGALFYLAGFYMRISPSVMTSELMRDFQIGAGELGNLSAFYFYFYVAMQIPVGILVDAWGARRLLVYGAISAALGTFLFGATDNFAMACVGRAVVGGATAVGWLVILKLASHWFPSRKFAMLSGLGLLFGNIGALTAQVPLRLLIEQFGWRGVIVASSVMILGVGLLAWIFVRNDPAEKGMRSHAPVELQGKTSPPLSTLLAGFGRVFKYRNTWLIFCAQGGLVGPMLTFTGLWGTPFLIARFGVESTTAAAICSVMIVCWAVASPIAGHLSDHFGKRKPIYLFGTLISTIGWITMFYATALPLPVFLAVASVTSFASGCVILGFAYGKESVPVRFLGTVSGTINIGNMIGPTLLQPAVGVLLDRNWSGEMLNGTRVYSSTAFESAFLLLVAWSVLACLMISFTSETGCKQRET